MHTFRTYGRTVGLSAVLALSFVLSACGGGVPGIGGGNEGNPLPTPLPGEEIGSEAESAAEDSPEATWENYLRDSIAEQINERSRLITLRERYEDPDITAQNLGGILQNIELVEDRTSWNISGNSASSFVEYDVRLTYANGDSETKTCRYNVGLQFNEEDGAWYVLNPGPLQVFANCT